MVKNVLQNLLQQVHNEVRKRSGSEAEEELTLEEPPEKVRAVRKSSSSALMSLLGRRRTSSTKNTDDEVVRKKSTSKEPEKRGFDNRIPVALEKQKEEKASGERTSARKKRFSKEGRKVDEQKEELKEGEKNVAEKKAEKPAEKKRVGKGVNKLAEEYDRSEKVLADLTSEVTRPMAAQVDVKGIKKAVAEPKGEVGELTEEVKARGRENGEVRRKKEDTQKMKTAEGEKVETEKATSSDLGGKYHLEGESSSKSAEVAQGQDDVFLKTKDIFTLRLESLQLPAIEWKPYWSHKSKTEDFSLYAVNNETRLEAKRRSTCSLFVEKRKSFFESLSGSTSVRNGKFGPKHSHGSLALRGEAGSVKIKKNGEESLGREVLKDSSYVELLQPSDEESPKDVGLTGTAGEEKLSLFFDSDDDIFKKTSSTTEEIVAEEVPTASVANSEEAGGEAAHPEVVPREPLNKFDPKPTPAPRAVTQRIFDSDSDDDLFKKSKTVTKAEESKDSTAKAGEKPFKSEKVVMKKQEVQLLKRHEKKGGLFEDSDSDNLFG